MVTVECQPSWAFSRAQVPRMGDKTGTTDYVECPIVGKEASHAKTPIRGMSRQDAKTPRFVGLGKRKSEDLTHTFNPNYCLTIENDAPDPP